MTSFSDIVFDNSEPDYDQTPEEFNSASFEDAEVPDEDNRSEDEPGAGDSYQGTDLTVFDEQNQVIDEQSATNPNTNQVGTDDDPESVENEGDVAYSDNEQDHTSEPINNDKKIDATDNIEYPEQGIDKQELVYKEPERIPRLEELDIIFDQQLEVLKYDFLNFTDVRIEDSVTDEFITGSVTELVDDFDLVQDFFTSPSSLFSFNDILGGIDQDTFLIEFQVLNADDV